MTCSYDLQDQFVATGEIQADYKNILYPLCNSSHFLVFVEIKLWLEIRNKTVISYAYEELFMWYYLTFF